ncbi:hypothetical protein DY000_02017511 [Brassica cretica]|uniref:Uncharacterized protein n=1 Tax=Brassica cretica TaxID=69181 RepID=A0ABQ7DCD4_BRACR|nr:hypothetical protein DY000_02017511 [Brassica cretica]
MTHDRVWCPVSSDHNTSQHIKTATVVASPLPREIKPEPSSLLRHGYNLRSHRIKLHGELLHLRQCRTLLPRGSNPRLNRSHPPQDSLFHAGLSSTVAVLVVAVKEIWRKKGRSLQWWILE